MHLSSARRAPYVLGFLVAVGAVVACGDDEADVSSEPQLDGGGSTSGSSGAGSSGGSSSGDVAVPRPDAGPDAAPDSGVASVELYVEGFCTGICSELKAGTTRPIAARVLDAAGAELALPVAWESSNPAVATIDASGVVQGLTEGSVTVRGTAGGVTGALELTILRSAIVRIELTPPHVDLASVGATAAFTAKAFDRFDHWVQNAPIDWYSADPSIGTVSSAGVFTGTGQGHVIVQAGSGNAGGWASVTVVSPISSRPAALFDQVSGGAHHACGVRAGKAYCWGYNYYGQLGNGEAGSDVGIGTPRAVTGGLAFASMAAGEYHSCGITTAGAAYCWGLGGTGELGNGDESVLGSQVPLPVVGGLVFAQLAAGGSHTCGLTTAGALYCWGSDLSGAVGLGLGEKYFAPQAVTPNARYTDVVTGLDHTCALRTDHTVACWGSNSSGAVGVGAAEGASVLVPTDLPGGRHFTSIDSYGTHTCGVEDDQSIWCWGRNDTGQAGNGTTTDNLVPVKLESTATFARVTTGAHHTCALTIAGQTLCTGDGGWGQLGAGQLDFANRLQPVVGGLVFVDLEAGSHFTCGRLPSGATYCWGASSSGQLGGGYVGGEILSTVPNPVVAAQ